MSAFQVDEDEQRENVLVSLMEDAIDLMDKEDQAGYLEAVRRCPDIVKAESEFIDFLRFEDYNIWKATKRLLKYWEWRIKVFGDRAFRPLFDMSGEGVLDEVDLKILATKAHMGLPRDSNGDKVWMFDASKYGEELSPQRFLRQFFFVNDFASRELRSEGEAIPSYGVISLSSTLPPWLKSKQSWVGFASEALMFKCKWYRVLVLTKDKSDKVWFQAIFPTFEKEVAKRCQDNIPRYEFLCDETEEGMKWKLVSLGMKEENLPPSLGGTWSTGNFSVWDLLPGILEKTRCRPVLPEIQPKPADERVLEKIRSMNLNDCSNQSVIRQMKSYMHGAEIENLPYGSKVAWIDAQRNPDLVQNESFFLEFYRFHNGQCFKAAQHIISHWTMREKLFSIRAYSNMNQIGSGALHKNDIETLQSGFLTLLPNDRQGNCIFFYNPSRLQKPILASQRRILFYMLFSALKQSSNDKTTVKFIVFLKKAEFQRDKKRKLLFHDIISSFPIGVVSHHLILQQEGLDDESYRKQATTKVASCFNIAANEIMIHTLFPGLDVLDELAVYGLKPENIPSSMGGSWDDECFLNWQNETIRYEATYRCPEPFRDEENWKNLQRKLDQILIGDDKDQTIYERVMEVRKRATMDADSAINYNGGIRGSKKSAASLGSRHSADASFDSRDSNEVVTLPNGKTSQKALHRNLF